MRKILLSIGFITSITCLLLACSSDTISEFWDSIIPETNEDPTQSQISTYVFKPAQLSATDERIQQLRVPQGFSVRKFADELGEARILAATSSGHVYVTNREDGEVILLEDTNGDGAADRREVVATLEDAHGLAVFDNKLYIVTIKEIYAADINTNGTLGAPQLIYGGLPDGGQHPNRTLGFGPDGMMYVSVGSTCNACPEPNPLHATMLQANPDGSNMRIYAEGLRNTIGFGWHPETSMFWGMDHGIDKLGDDVSHEELNHIIDGAHYGWPYIFDDGRYNAYPRPEDMTYAEFAAMSTFPSLMYTAHAAPMQMVFYTGNQFPADYNGDAFVAYRGSWNRSTPEGYKVSRIIFENGTPVRFEDFLTGFLVNNNNAHFGRLVGLAVHADGSLLVSDDTNGVIYRIAHNQ
ncbi:PQQ-dependent sugar dehydrogenase [Anditalea andensis]|uniref:Oxidoreductase n=1 Tax=Anditalea andensis TaxID=1048983 RepID=A0A074L0J1_9BACT|nr:PQQ-dependent sugar dehydrogenase [Anditalea andensis]KEO75751.1 oxidoreductase [Anditalea andensis]